MPIEFNCHVCGKLLRTSDDKAGRTAKCPGCGEGLQVPDGEFDPTEEESADDYQEQEASHEDSGGEEYDDDEFGEQFGAVPTPGETGGTRLCPMCGESISTRAARCEFCGEDVGVAGSSRRGDVQSTQVDAGEVISTSWEIFKSEMGVCIGGYVIMMVIMMMVAGARGVCTNVIAMGAGGMGGNQQQNAGAAVLLIGIVVIATFLEFCVQQFLRAGFQRLLLNVARGKNPEVGDLFSVGPFYLRYLGNSILFSLMVGFGSLACIVPGILLALMFWPFGFLILDRNLPGTECLSRAKEITEGNWGAVFVIALAAFGINILGFCALCIGLIFTVPLTMLMFAVAYCRMSGRATVRV